MLLFHAANNQIIIIMSTITAHYNTTTNDKTISINKSNTNSALKSY